MSDAIFRAHADLDADRAWKARDRLAGVLTHRQDDEVLDLLANVYYDLGALPRAGALWQVTGRDDARAAAAADAWRERYGDEDSRWRSIPAVVRRERLGDRPGRAGLDDRQIDASAPGSTLATVGCLLVLAAVLVLASVGLWTASRWVLG